MSGTMTYLIEDFQGDLTLVEVRSLESAIQRINYPEKGFKIIPINQFYYEDGRVDENEFDSLEEEAKALKAENEEQRTLLERVLYIGLGVVNKKLWKKVEN